MYRTLSSVNDHEYKPTKKGPSCGARFQQNAKCNILGCVKCQPSCEICGLYHPTINYIESKNKSLTFNYSRDNVFSKDYQHFLYHNFEPDNKRPPGHSISPSNNKYCYSSSCSLCRPTCKHCGKVEQNHEYR